MKRIVFLVLLAVAVPSFAQSGSDFRIFGYLADPGGGRTHDRTYVDAGFGLGLTKFITPSVAVELSVTSFDWHSNVMTNGVIERSSTQTYPISLDAQYHFATESAWKPYLGIGSRYVASGNLPSGGYANRSGLELNGGVAYEATPRLLLRIDGKRGLGSTAAPHYDPLTHIAFGIGWKF